MIRHLNDTDLARIVAGSCTPREAGDAVLHLAVCAGCHRHLLSSHPRKGRRFLETWLEGFARRKGVEVDELAAGLPAVFSPLGLEEAETIRSTPNLTRSLEGLSEAHQRLHVANSPRFQTLAFLEHSLAEARRHWHSNPNEAIRWASVAVTAGERASQVIATPYGEAIWSDVLARAWAYLANGRRIAGNLHAADEAFAKSRRFLGRGTGAAEVRAEVLCLEGSLRRAQRRFQESWLAASEAERIYEAIGLRQAAASTALVGASALAEAGQLQPAIWKLRRSLGRLSERDLGGPTHFYLLQNLACTLVEANRPGEASILMPQIRELSTLIDEPLTQLRIEWLEGQLHSQVAATTFAEAAFRKVRRGFLAAGSPYDAALVSLDLAVLLIEDGRKREAAKLAGDLVPIFRSQGIHREAMAAGMLAARSLSEQTATVDLVEKVAAYLRKARLDPTYRFPG